jgi:hypothetical protein
MGGESRVMLDGVKHFLAESLRWFSFARLRAVARSP